MGLYAGISILTGAEVLVLILDLFKSLILGLTTSGISPQKAKDETIKKSAVSCKTELTSIE